MNSHTDGQLTRWPVYLVGLFIILWSLLNVGGGWFPLYAGAYFGSHPDDAEVLEKFEFWMNEQGKDPRERRGIDWRKEIAELEKSGKLPRSLTVAMPIALKFSHYQPLLMYVYVPFGLLAAIGAMVFRRWGWWCALVWLGTWVIITLTMAMAFRSIADWLSISLTVITLVITAIAFWLIWVRRPMYSGADGPAASSP